MGSRSVGKSSLAIQFAQVRLPGAVACVEGDLLQTTRYTLPSGTQNNINFASLL